MLVLKLRKLSKSLTKVSLSPMVTVAPNFNTVHIPVKHVRRFKYTLAILLNSNSNRKLLLSNSFI